MSDYTLSIVTYDRGARWDEPDKEKPYHWAFVLQPDTTSSSGHSYQLHGIPGAFYYSGEESLDAMESVSKNGELQVGVVPVARLARFREILAAVVVIDGVESPEWNCQSWSLGVLDGLRAEGLVGGNLPNRVICDWLREDQ